jgi:regulator of nucleoside diphosphate kinase
MERDIYITDFDLKRLMELVRVGLTLKAKDGEYFHSLEQELNRAHTVKPHEIPQVVVTMNSRIRLKEVQSGRATGLYSGISDGC